MTPHIERSLGNIDARLTSIVEAMALHHAEHIRLEERISKGENDFHKMEKRQSRDSGFLTGAVAVLGSAIALVTLKLKGLI